MKDGLKVKKETIIADRKVKTIPKSGVIKPEDKSDESSSELEGGQSNEKS